MRGRFFLPHTLPNGVFFATMMTSPQAPPFPFPFLFLWKRRIHRDFAREGLHLCAFGTKSTGEQRFRTDPLYPSFFRVQDLGDWHLARKASQFSDFITGGISGCESSSRLFSHCVCLSLRSCAAVNRRLPIRRRNGSPKIPFPLSRSRKQIPSVWRSGRTTSSLCCPSPATRITTMCKRGTP